MVDKTELMAVGCVCGHKFRVRKNATNATIACPKCGHAINLSPSVALERVPGHWSRNLLWTVWAVPVCIAVLGVLYIISRELSDNRADRKSNQPTEHPAVPDANPTSPQEPVTLVLHPGSPLDQIVDLDVQAQFPEGIAHLKTTGVFKEDNGDLLTTSGEVTALKLAENKEEFSLSLLGDFAERGGMYVLFGWDHESSSGYALTYSRMVTYGHWQLMRVEHGRISEFPHRLDEYRITSGELKLSVNHARLDVSFSGANIVEKHILSRYSAGDIIIGTFPNRYKGSVVRLKRIALTAEPVQKPVKPKVAAPRNSPLDGVAGRDLFPGPGFENPNEFSISRELYADFVPAEQGRVIDGKLSCPENNSCVLRIVDWAEDFELSFEGEFYPQHLMLFVGWNSEENTGYLIMGKKTNHGDFWCLYPVVEGSLKEKLFISRINGREMGTLTMRVENKNLSLQFADEMLLNEFNLPHYNPGRVMIGAKGNIPAFRIEKIRIRESGNQ